ncbi:MAG TPA: hypothetical protein VLY24_03255 [Bryobacteraceae bacterium]|nr:hypothetical protein [Bryobacteraceae bacterium]
MKWSTSLLLFACAVPAFCADSTDLLSLLPPSADIVFGIHVHATIDSTLARGILSQMHVNSTELPKIIPIDGFDPLSDLDEVVFASTGEGDNPPMLVVARGKFDLTRMTSKGKLYHGVRLIVTESENEESGFAVIDPATVMMGDVSEIKASIDRRIKSHVYDQVRWAQLADYRDKYTLWGVAERPSNLVKKLQNYTAAPALDAIDHIQFGVGLAKGIEFEAELHTRSSDDLAQLTNSLKLLESMAKAARPSLDDGTKFGIDTKEDGTMRLRLEITEEQLVRAIQNQKPAEVAVTAAAEPVHKETAERKVRTNAPAAVDHSRDGGTSVFTLPGRR